MGNGTRYHVVQPKCLVHYVKNVAMQINKMYIHSGVYSTMLLRTIQLALFLTVIVIMVRYLSSSSAEKDTSKVKPTRCTIKQSSDLKRLRNIDKENLYSSTLGWKASSSSSSCSSCSSSSFFLVLVLVLLHPLLVLLLLLLLVHNHHSHHHHH